MTTATEANYLNLTDNPKEADIGRTLLTRSYATRENLESAKAYRQICDLRHLVLQLNNGRWTAVIADRNWQVALHSGFAILG